MNEIKNRRDSNMEDYNNEDNKSNDIENTGQTDKKQKEKKKYSWMIEMVCYILIFLLCIFVVPRYVAQRTVVSGNSMRDTLYSRDNLIVEKVSYRFTNPARYDIIILDPREEEEEYYVKRVIGLPGETIQVKKGMVYINGALLEGEHYGKDIIMEPGLAEDEITLGEDEYFVMGDNRNGSTDSRDIGPIKREQIKGKAIFRIWPLKRFGTID